MKVIEFLKAINAYPIPLNTFLEIGLKRDLSLDEEADMEIVSSKAYKLSKADVYMWLSSAPSVTQEGISYSFTDEQREQFTSRATAIYEQEEDNDSIMTPQKNIYGYIGSSF